MQKFPILAVTKEALALPFKYPMEMAKTLGLMIAGVFGVSILMAILVAIMGGAGMMGSGGTMMQQMEQGNFSGMGGMILIVFIVLLGVFWLIAYVFNYWVRLGAYGHDRAALRPLSKAWGAAGVTMVKMFLITILLVLVTLVVWYVLHLMGLVPSLADQMRMGAEGDMAHAARGGLATNIITTVITCVVYSIFSANLTQTALGSDKEGFEHPHTIDFAVVLMLLYAIVLIPMTLAEMSGSIVMLMLVVYVLEFYVMLAIATAHGLRYRICVADMPDVPETSEA
ncbi:hypothetical protein [Kordiimonas marina]|uniref:hypothetical protein n=1 Tax=Kordiimonas marina TaxID=2872312 RepID=UPI001FF15CE2|nr:hypothetical protein [Kordiimonas marina]MCJ9430242.1 hypothetical protein [Kordiimonas marina]